jgi:hypothetical protein
VSFALPAGRAGFRRFLTIILAAVILAAASAAFAAPEKKVALSFTKELLYNIARDNEDQMKEEILSRLLGLSPAVSNVDIIRSGGDVILVYTMDAAENLPVTFRLVIEKLAFYRMAAAREDVAGMLRILEPVKAKEPLIASLAYRYNDRYSIIDLAVDVGPALEKREKAEMAKAAVALTPKETPKETPKAEPKPEPKPEPPKKEEKKPEPKPTPKKETPEKEAKKEPQPPAKPTFLSVGLLTKTAPPEIDGRNSDPAWTQAEPFSFGVKGESGTFRVTAAALRDKERIYFLLSWPDKKADREHRPWVWSADEGAYLAGKALEDALAMQFARKGKIGVCMLAGKAVEADLWFWRAARTNPVGYAEDASMRVSLERIPKANSYEAKNKRTVWIKDARDSGTGPYSSNIAGTFAGEKVERYLPREPSGSAADVRARGSWSDGVWTLEIVRSLKTGDEKDVVFSQGEERYFSVAVYNARERGGHSSSREHLLKFE